MDSATADMTILRSRVQFILNGLPVGTRELTRCLLRDLPREWRKPIARTEHVALIPMAMLTTRGRPMRSAAQPPHRHPTLPIPRAAKDSTSRLAALTVAPVLSLHAGVSIDRRPILLPENAPILPLFLAVSCLSATGPCGQAIPFSPTALTRLDIDRCGFLGYRPRRMAWY